MAKVLIVDDDFMIADCLEEILLDAGYEVCGIAGSIAEGVKLGMQHNPDLGIIDLRLADGEYGTEIGAALHQRGECGVLYATGNPDHPLLRQAKGEGCIAKPYSATSVVSALRIVGDLMAGRALSSPFPQGFRLLRA